MTSAKTPAMQDPFLVGEHIYLRALRPEDADGPYPTWFNDAETCAGNSHHVFPYTRQAALEYIEMSRKAGDCLILAIVLNDSGRHVGNIALQRVHAINRSAELSFLIGDPSARGRKVGLEAGRLLCAHGFSAMNLQRIACATYANNSAMLKLAVALGMKQEGTRRQAAYKLGRYVDVVEFGLLKEEFLERNAIE